MELMDHQKEAIRHLGSGKILWGGVGSGKSATVLGYYVDNEKNRDIYVITTAKKRDSLDWEKEAAKFGIGTDRSATCHGVLHVDSWNNIGNYTDIEGAFFIFDEQRVVGYGAWVKSFLKIAKKNHWVLLSATPGDTWLDYAPVFIANGWYRNITHFKMEHVLYEPFMKYPKIRGYLKQSILEKRRDEVLVEMPFIKHTQRHINWLEVGYDEEKWRRVWRERWHIYEDRPIKDVAELWRVARKVINSDPSRFQLIRDLMRFHDKLIIFYNFDYELEILRWLGDYTICAEWNGHKKEPIPESDQWVYLVQYVSGSESWNCVETDAMVLYSLTYSYKNFEQCQGRIDRLDTPFTDLYYYCFVSNSVVDKAIKRSLINKKSFNERSFMGDFEASEEFEDEKLELCQI